MGYLRGGLLLCWTTLDRVSLLRIGLEPELTGSIGIGAVLCLPRRLVWVFQLYVDLLESGLLNAT